MIKRKNFIENRNINFDLLRIVSCYLVITIHTLGANKFLFTSNSFEWKVFNLYDSLARACVPLFFMISGYFLLSYSEEKLMKNKYFFIKKSFKLFLLYLFSSLFYNSYQLIALYGIKNLNIKDILNLITNSIFNPKYHLWFLPTMITIYLIFPLIYSFIHNMKSYPYYIKYVLVLFFIVGVLKPTLTDHIFPLLNINCSLTYKLSVVTQQQSNYFYLLISYITYFVLGYLINVKINIVKTKNITLLFIYFLSSFINALLNYIYSCKNNIDGNLFYEYNSITTFISAICLFMIFSKIYKNNIIKANIRKAIEICSKNTLFVYVSHIFILELLQYIFNLNAVSFNPIFSVPLLSLLIFILCEIISLFINIIINYFKRCTYKRRV